MSISAVSTPGRRLGAPLAALFLLLLGAQFLLLSVGTRQVLLWIVGAALGITLYHAAFGFTSAWRVFIRERRGAGLRAQMVMLAVAVVLFFPALGAGTLFGQPVNGLVAPAGVSVIVGAFILASACSWAEAARPARCSRPVAATRACWSPCCSSYSVR